MSRDQLKEKAELGFEQHRQTEQLLQLLLLLLSPRTSFLCKSKFFRLRNVWETCQLNNHMRMSEVFIGISNEKRNRTPLITNYNFYCDLIIKKKIRKYAIINSLYLARKEETLIINRHRYYYENTRLVLYHELTLFGRLDGRDLRHHQLFTRV